MYPPHERERLEIEERVRQEFNRWAVSGRTAEMERAHRPVTEKLIARMAVDPADSILEVGCGDGWAVRRLAALCPQGAVVGIDVADEMIDLARRKSVEFSNVLFSVGAAEEIPWAEDYFQHIVSVESAYYWPSPERAVRELFRVAAHGGRIYTLMHYYQENPHARHWQQHVELPLQLKSAEQWARLFSNFGFEPVETCQLPDETPVPEDFEPDVHWRSREEKLAFQRIGALLITARKPPLPPPGPISPLHQPFPIVG